MRYAFYSEMIFNTLLRPRCGSRALSIYFISCFLYTLERSNLMVEVFGFSLILRSIRSYTRRCYSQGVFITLS